MPSRQLRRVRQSFVDRGISISDWAEARGFRRESVYAVLSGRVTGRRGTSHAIAVALGLKPSTAGPVPGGRAEIIEHGAPADNVTSGD